MLNDHLFGRSGRPFVSFAQLLSRLGEVRKAAEPRSCAREPERFPLALRN